MMFTADVLINLIWAIVVLIGIICFAIHYDIVNIP